MWWLYMPISYHTSSAIYILINKFLLFIYVRPEDLIIGLSLSLWAQTHCGDPRILLFKLKGYIIRLIWSYQLLEFFLRINHDFFRIILKISLKTFRQKLAKQKLRKKKKESTCTSSIKSTIGLKKAQYLLFFKNLI